MSVVGLPDHARMEPALINAADRKIRIEGLSKEFPGFVALRDVNLEIKEGEFLSLLGPSGCGKTTLLEIMAGLQKPSAGRVLVDGKIVERPGPERAVVFQHYALFPWRSVAKNVEFPLEVAGIPAKERRERALGFLRTVGLEPFAQRAVWQLSGGMQQRVALARALACSPKVMLMDEPFSGADAITRELLQDQLSNLHRATGKTIVFVTHSVDEAIRLSNRIIVLGTRPGRVVAHFEVDDVLRTSTSATSELRHTIWTILRREILPD
jgi:NitT/TauT family transport system ATP-binding protein